MRSPQPRTEWLTLTLLTAAAVGLAFSPQNVQTSVVASVRDVAAPLQAVARWAWDSAAREWTEWRHPESIDDTAERQRLAEELDAWKTRSRSLEARLATLREEHESGDRTGTPPSLGETGQPLLVTELLSAAVLGEENTALCRGGKLLRVGASEGIAESALVLEDQHPLIDQGSLSGLETGHEIFAGRCVVGRVARVGRWVSTVIPVGDPEFRGLARIIRRTAQGPVFGAKGLLEGDADGLCRLRHIPATEPVSEGDEIYTAGGDANNPEPMWYGTIVKAELPAGSPHWEIRVRPAATLAEVKTVQVLRKKPNPVRLLAQ
jgi:cell shape-determining protein MreC